MDFLSGLTKSKETKAAEEAAKPVEKAPGPDMLTSAKGAVAGATADAIGAASNFGKLDKTQGVGKSADEAETYLREVHASAAAEKK